MNNTIIKSLSQSKKYLQPLKKLIPNSKPDIATSESVFKSCSSLPAVDAGLVNHGYLIKCGIFGCCDDIRHSLVSMYVNLGKFWDAYKVFEEMPMRRNVYVVDCIINGFGYIRSYKDVVDVFHQMVGFCVVPSVHSLCHVIKACSELNSIEKGLFLYDYVKKHKFDVYIVVMNSLISMFVKMGRLDFAQQVFNNVVYKDIVSWNSMITGYAQNKNWEKVFDFFLWLRRVENLVPNVVTFLGLLSSVGHAKEVGIGMSIHGHLICTGFYLDVQLGTAVFNMYAKCERLDFAEAVFEEDLIRKTLVSWNALIAAYKRKGYAREAVEIYERMVVEPDMKPDSFSFANVLPAYKILGNIQRIKVTHSMIIKMGIDIEKDVVLSTAMLDAYGTCSDVMAAEFLFACIHHLNTATWNALICVYNLNNLIEKGMLTFREMVRHKVYFDSLTMVAIFQSCGLSGFLKQGNMIHGFCLLKGVLSHLIVGNALIDMYMRCGCTKSAEAFFRSMYTDNTVTWNTMIYGYMKNGCSFYGFRIFNEMQSENEHKPDYISIISLLHGSFGVSASNLDLIHAYILKQGLTSDTQVNNILIDAYAKTGIIEKARELFMQSDFVKDQRSWNIMIAGYGMNGQAGESSKLFDQMVNNGYAPDAITFTSLLSSFSHCGLVEDGCKFFAVMITKYKIQPSLEHWTCIIDMLGRANGLEEAYDVIKAWIYEKSCESVSLNSVVWGALLSACKNNMNMEVGEIVGQKLSKMESDKYYSLISNMYSSNEKWEEAVEVRKVFGDGKVMKKRGFSCLKS